MDTVIATWFVADQPGQETQFPQMNQLSSTAAFQRVYWRCIAVFFATSVRVNPGRRHVLFTNTSVPADIAGLLAGWGVETVGLPFRRRPPRGYHGSFGNQFYIFDILDHAAGWGQLVKGRPARLIVLDSDCVWLRPADAMEAAIDAGGVLAYRIAYDEQQPVNGASRRDMKAVAEAVWGRTLPQVPDYCGGEIFAARTEALPGLMRSFDTLWQANLERWRAGQPKLNEEAHFLSLIYLEGGYPPASANRFIRRIWTNFRSRNSSADDVALTVWHLPSEKKTGLADLYGQVVRPDSAFWTVPVDESYVRLLGRAIGIPRRSAFKFVRDLALKLREKSARLVPVSAR